MLAPKVTTPLLHINGSGRDNLVNGYHEAWHRLCDAFEAVARTAPHMRDYYPLVDGKQKYEMAMHEHIHRLTSISSLQDQFVALIEALTLDLPPPDAPPTAR